MWIKVSAALLLVCMILGLLYSYERRAANKANTKVAVAEQQAQEAVQELTKAKLSFRIDLDAISEAQKQKDNIVLQTQKVKEKVDEVAKQVEAKQLSDADADTQLLNSMWEVYCQGSLDSIDSSRCPHSSNKSKSSSK